MDTTGDLEKDFEALWERVGQDRHINRYQRTREAFDTGCNSAMTRYDDNMSRLAVMARLAKTANDILRNERNDLIVLNEALASSNQLYLETIQDLMNELGDLNNVQ